ncbi:cell wall hydrolase [[Clostridium] polysaccharolyticum]|uniref:N-acetylmuramoyl-L-alanine amidase n=1 Tax=[Clostridium] polysaccharolyticum TaxID=29364 RepID=A0A1H9ZEQ0_9FIRM|nr:cell wall hydrolase [[Clostridium] polysaccharolyticum]SES80064.1 N-acetylmuramoyl-L-alanine amidase [[Clostridium] polysaccharolyticum]
MKNRKLLMRVKAYTNNLFFSGCKWSMLITAYALIAIIIAMSSESRFSEGVYAKEVGNPTEAYLFGEQDDVLCMGNAIQNDSEEIETADKQENAQDTAVRALSTKAFEENYARMEAFKQESGQLKNVNIIDSVANDPVEKRRIKQKQAKEKQAKSKKEVEAFLNKKEGKNAIKLASGEKDILLRIVEAEATGEDITGKMLVANVVLNRVKSTHFPDSVEGVVFQRSGSVYQFSPIKDRRYYQVSISDETKEAVDRVLGGEDKSEGALYFMSRSRAVASSVTWFDRALTKVFQHGTHEFYK